MFPMPVCPPSGLYDGHSKSSSVGLSRDYKRCVCALNWLDGSRRNVRSSSQAPTSATMHKIISLRKEIAADVAERVRARVLPSDRLGLRCDHVFHDACACYSMGAWQTDCNYVEYSEVLHLCRAPGEHGVPGTRRPNSRSQPGWTTITGCEWPLARAVSRTRVGICAPNAHRLLLSGM